MPTVAPKLCLLDRWILSNLVSSTVFPELSEFTACIFIGTVISMSLKGFFLGHYFTCMDDCKNYSSLYNMSLINVYPANHKICIHYKLFIEVTSENVRFYAQKCSHMQHKQFSHNLCYKLNNADNFPLIFQQDLCYYDH